MPLFQTNQVGIREDLADYIAVVDAKSTPFVSMAPKGKDLGNMTFSWQADNYDAPSLGGVIEGADVTVSSASNPVTNRARLNNYAQAFRQSFRIGFIAETQNVAGITSEVANGISKSLITLKRSMEATFLMVNQAAVQGSGTSTAYTTGSLGNWLTSTNSSNFGACAATGAGSNYQPQGGAGSGGSTSSYAVSNVTSANLTEATVQNVLTAIYNKTGVFRDYDLILGTTLKRAFTNLTAGGSTATTANSNTIAATSVRTFNQEIGSDTFKSSIDIFEGDFGRLILHPDVWIGWNDSGTHTVLPQIGYVIPMDMVEIRYAKLPEVIDLPNAGGGPARLVQAIAGLVVKNPGGFGMFNGAS